MDICPRAATRLFQSVLNRAFEDAISTPKPDNKEGIRERDTARKWLIDSVADFAQVCQFAGYEPSYIRGKAEKLAEQGWPKLNNGMKLAA